MSTIKRLLWKHPVARGQAMVEFSLAVLIFLLFVFGIIEVGRATYTRGGLAFAVQRGARVGALPVATSDTMVKDAVRNALPGLGVAVANVSVAVTSATGSSKAFTARTTGDRITVTVTHTYTPIARFVFRAFPTFSMSARAVRGVE